MPSPKDTYSDTPVPGTDVGGKQLFVRVHERVHGKTHSVFYDRGTVDAFDQERDRLMHRRCEEGGLDALLRAHWESHMDEQWGRVEWVHSASSGSLCYATPTLAAAFAETVRDFYEGAVADGLPVSTPVL